MITRRNFLLSGISAATAGLAGCRAWNMPIRAVDLSRNQWWGFTTSLRKEHQYEARVEGKIPPQLRGTLYRNGPGLFDRGGMRKRSVLDGDGMIQSFRFHDGGVTYRNRFVRTEKFVAEEAAGRFLYATWSTEAPGGMFANLFLTSLRNQAGVTVTPFRDRLYAFDEASYPYELDPATLQTSGLSYLGLPADFTVYAAHFKFDSATGEWLHFGVNNGLGSEIHVTCFGPDGDLRFHRSLPLPRNNYMHDWFVTERHVIFNLHPGEVTLFPLLTGQKSIMDSLSWHPEKGNLLMILPRDGEGEPVFVEAEGCWMWHSLNAWEEGGEIVCDFVGYRKPDHIIGNDPSVIAVMEGRTGDAECPGQIRRYRIDTVVRRVREEVLERTYDYEFPIVNPRLACRRSRFGYFIAGKEAFLFPNAIARFDGRTGNVDRYRFAEGEYCTEAVFVPVPGVRYEADGEEPGWLLTETFSASRGTGALAIFRSDRVADGPLATVKLKHHVPFSFHGVWQEG